MLLLFIFFPLTITRLLDLPVFKDILAQFKTKLVLFSSDWIKLTMPDFKTGQLNISSMKHLIRGPETGNGKSIPTKMKSMITFIALQKSMMKPVQPVKIQIKLYRHL